MIRNFRKNVLSSLFGAVIPIVVLLVTVPLYLSAIGENRYGLLALVWIVLGYFSFMDMGLGRATANQIAGLKEGSLEDRSEVFWSAVAVNLVFGFVAASFLWLIGNYLLGSAWADSHLVQTEVAPALPWLVGTLPLALLTSVFSGALEGRQEFLWVNSLQVSSVLAFQLVPLLVAQQISPSLVYVIPAAVLSKVIMLLPMLAVCIWKLPLKNLPRFSTRRVKSLISYGGWIAVTGIIGPILETIDRIVIGAMLDAKAVTYYTVPHQLVTKLRIIPGSVSRVLFPSFSSMGVSHSIQIADRSLVVLVSIMTPVVFTAIFFIEPFLILWLGVEVALRSAPLAEIFLLGIWASGIAQIAYALLQGMGRPDIVAKLHAVEMLPYLLLLCLGIHFFGLYGAALAWVVRVVFDAMCLLLISGAGSTAYKNIFVPLVFVLGSYASNSLLLQSAIAVKVALVFTYISLFLIWLGCSEVYRDIFVDLLRRKSGFQQL